MKKKKFFNIEYERYNEFNLVILMVVFIIMGINIRSDKGYFTLVTFKKIIDQFAEDWDFARCFLLEKYILITMNFKIELEQNKTIKEE